MLALITLTLVSFLLCFTLTPLVRDYALRAGMVDKSDGDRKLHARDVPRIGGIPIVVSCAITFALLYWISDAGGKLYIQHGAILHAVLPGAGIIFLVGLADDLFGLKPWQKLLGEVVAAVLVLSLGVSLELFHVPQAVCVLISFAWLICATNAVNLIDGMDGLATGVGLSATLTTMSIALMYHHTGLVILTAPLAGALLAFLRYNFNPASIFLGDCGSLTIGFILGCYGLLWSQKVGTFVGLAAPIVALALPLTDVGIAICRRYLRKVPIFSPDRGHIHHRVLALGFSTKRAALILYAACLGCAAFSVLVSASHRALRWSLFAVFLVLVVAGVNRLGYIEFSAALRTLSRKRLRRAVSQEIYVQELVKAIEGSESIDACWQVLRAACHRLEFASARLDVQGRIYYEEFVDVPEEDVCGIELGLGRQRTLLLTRDSREAVSMVALHSLQAMMTHRLQYLDTLGLATQLANRAA